MVIPSKEEIEELKNEKLKKQLNEVGAKID